MIRCSQQWCIQIDITNGCHLHCSNCTRMLDHARKRFWMSPEKFRECVEAVKDFPLDSEPCPQGRRKVVGMIGGEPLLHPHFPALVDIICELIPEQSHRGLWTSKDWKTESHPKWGPHRPQVERLLGRKPNGEVRAGRSRFGFLNWNQHKPEMKVHHQPMLVSISDVVEDEKHKWELIRDCWVQREWSASFTPKGFFFCEVAAAFDMIFDGPGGRAIEPGCWQGEIEFKEDENGIPRPVGPFAEQIEKWCQQCGACLPMQSRLDSENCDDISESNLVQLQGLGSPRVKKKQLVEFNGERWDEEKVLAEGWKPNHYIRGARK